MLERAIEVYKDANKFVFGLISIVIYLVLFAVYKSCIKGLEMPAGYTEALMFLLKKPSDYLVAWFFGILLNVLPIILFVLVFIGILAIISGISMDDEYMFRSRKVNVIGTIILFVIWLSMVILNSIYVKYVGVLSVLLIILGVIGLALFAPKN